MRNKKNSDRIEIDKIVSGIRENGYMFASKLEHFQLVSARIRS